MHGLALTCWSIASLASYNKHFHYLPFPSQVVKLFGFILLSFYYQLLHLLIQPPELRALIFLQKQVVKISSGEMDFLHMKNYQTYIQQPSATTHNVYSHLNHSTEPPKALVVSAVSVILFCEQSCKFLQALCLPQQVHSQNGTMNFQISSRRLLIDKRIQVFIQDCQLLLAQENNVGLFDLCYQ